MASEAEEAFGQIFTGVGTATHEFGDLGQVCVQDHTTIEFDFDLGAFHSDFLEVPFSRFAEVTANGRNHAVSRPVILPVIQLGVLGMLGIEHLKFSHRIVGWVSLTGVSNGKAVVPPGGTLNSSRA